MARCPAGTTAFVVTFASFACFHAARKTFSAVKPVLVSSSFFTGLGGSWTQDEMSGLVDAAFLAFYAVGLFFAGGVADRHDAGRVLLVGHLGAAVCVFAFALAGLAGMRSAAFYAALWGLHGLFQSLSWPACLKILSDWFPAASGHRGFVLGLWGCSSSVGNILGGTLAAIAQRVAPRRLYWEATMLMGGAFILLVGVLGVGACLRASPGPPHPLLATSLLAVVVADDDEDDEGGGGRVDEPAFGASCGRLCLLPDVVCYAAAYACMKSIAYSFLFWLPFYLSTAFTLGPTLSNVDAAAYDVGQLLGAVGAGVLLDRYLQGKAHGTVAAAGLLLACVPVAILAAAGGRGLSLSATVLLALACGVLVGGPSSVVAGIASADIGERAAASSALSGSAVGQVAGIVDGTGSLAAAAVQLFVGSLSACKKLPHDGERCLRPDGCQVCRWRPVFEMMLVCLVIACLALSRRVVREWQTPEEEGREPRRLRRAAEKS